jgi:peptidoglycan/LPS O-acetylase OafA/YrhL
MSAFVQAPLAVSAAREAGLPTTKKSTYQPQLDGLRGIAILSVLLHHFEVRLPGLFDWGPIGVRIFFLLSGYLITQSLWRLQEDAREAGGGYWAGLLGFHARRFVRLTPVLYVMLALACLMGLPEFRHALAWHMVFLSNFFALHVGKWPAAASHLWSLSVQEQFYLLWPFLILIAPRKFLPWVLLGLFFGAFAFRASIMIWNVSDFYRWVMLPAVIDSFALGALVACAKKSGRPLPFVDGWGGWLVGAAAFGCYILARSVRFGLVEGPWSAFIESLENLFFAWLLLRTAAGWRGVIGLVFENPILVYIGKISYGLYIFHVLVVVGFSPWLSRHGLDLQTHVLLRAAVLLTISIGVAALSFRYLESPLAAWVRRCETALPGVRSRAA